MVDSKVEEWRDVPGYAGMYRASSAGRIRGPTRMLRPACGADGYPRVVLWKDGRGRSTSVHIVVAAAFLGPKPDGMEVNHKDGVRANCSAANLEYVTHADNMVHSYRVTGLSRTNRERYRNTPFKPGREHIAVRRPEIVLRGERNGRAKLTEADVRAIRAEYVPRRVTVTALAAKYGVAHSRICAILAKKAWSHI